MVRRVIFALLFTLCFVSVWSQEQVALPGEEGRKAALELDYFPHRQYAFVWRNWSVVDKTRLAEVLSTSVENVERLAVSMGLPRQQVIEPEWATTRGYITIARRNWQLLSYEQLMQLLDMSREELRFRLIEDDFLYIKLGNLKPWCEPLRYEEPTSNMRQRAAQIAADVRTLGKKALRVEEPRFGFMREFDKVQTIKSDQPANSDSNGFELRMIFPYFTDYGDPLLDKELSSYPEELFRRLQEVGVNGIWLHSVLRTLVEPDEKGFPGDERAAERIAGMNRLVERAAKYGIKIYLYLNEPRAMGEEYFDGSPQRMSYAGSKLGDLYSFCSSNPEVLAWLSRSMESLFSQVDGLGGVFTITASENHTTCVSRNYHECPLCKDRDYADMIAEINTAIEQGVHKAAPDAKVIVWDWGWNDSQCEKIINQLPKECWFMTVSEWMQRIERGGVPVSLWEYSMSVEAPSARAKRNWEYARRAGLKTVAKVQVNATWEMAIVPSVPVLDLVARHATNLLEQDVDGVMLSWSLGGYPSENLKLFQSIKQGDVAEDVVSEFARNEYGDKVGELVREAWRKCSEGFENYPYHMNTVYYGPHHVGPSNPFYMNVTQYAATMVGIPYDNYDAWRSVYPLDVWIALHEKCADGFEQGVNLFRQAYKVAKGDIRDKVLKQLYRAEAVRIHHKSSAVQARFFEARNKFRKSESAEEREQYKKIMREQCLQEQELIRQMLPILSADSSVAFESSNQYFYLPADLVEAYISICSALRQIESM